MKKFIVLLFLGLFTLEIAYSMDKENPGEMIDNGIKVSSLTPFYWEYKDEQVLLLGASNNDNLFQSPGLQEELNEMVDVGANYVRCTMSSRDEGDLKAYKKNLNTGKYDLNKWNPEYWNKFESFLEMTSDREIIVQIGLWATYDFYSGNWEDNPFNPELNINYTEEETGLPSKVDYWQHDRINPFFSTVPRINNREKVLSYQQAFIDKILSYTFRYNHILYNIDNETSTNPEWGWYWAKYIRDKAEKAGEHIEVTEMWNKWDLNDNEIPEVRI